MPKYIAKLWKGMLVLFVLPVVSLIRLVRPWFLFRFDCVHNRMGHFSGDLELYLCGLDFYSDVPKKKYLDVFCVCPPACNSQLLLMWSRVLNWKPFWFVNSVLHANRLIPGGQVHEIKMHSRMGDRDIHGWLEVTKPHLKFTSEEEIKGENTLREFGLPKDCRFICLQVRDGVYHNDLFLYSHRNSDIDSYVLMAEKMAQMGYYVIRMGAKVGKRFNSKNDKIIDYPFSVQQNDFNDVYLGYKCFFCVTTNSGWDAIPRYLFRKPSVVTNSSRLAYEHTFFSNSIFITKKHVDIATNKFLGISEIVARGVHLGDPYESRGVRLVDHTPEEILEVTLEMVQRLDGSWKSMPEDEKLQEQFWKLFPIESRDVEFGTRLHGEIKARCGANFLRKNHEWLLE